jgi:tetratricopeptide (TPR) repeat protein
MMKHLLCSSALFLAGLVSLQAAEDAPNETIALNERIEALRTLQQENISIRYLGRLITGRIELLTAEAIEIEELVGDGAIGYFLPWSEVEGVVLPDESFMGEAFDLAERGNYAEALALLEALYSYRRPFFRVMEVEEKEPFLRGMDWSLAQGDFPRALGWVERLKPEFDDPRFSRRFLEVEISAYLELDLLEDAERRARRWIEESPLYGESAFGWVALARILARQDLLDRAFLAALQPIVFSSQLPMEYLDQAYALSAFFALEAEDFRQAGLLHSEMEERGLSWPKNLALSETDFLARLEAGPQSDPDIEEDPPEETSPVEIDLAAEEPAEEVAPARILPGAWLPRPQLSPTP